MLVDLACRWSDIISQGEIEIILYCYCIVLYYLNFEPVFLDALWHVSKEASLATAALSSHHEHTVRGFKPNQPLYTVFYQPYFTLTPLKVGEEKRREKKRREEENNMTSNKHVTFTLNKLEQYQKYLHTFLFKNICFIIVLKIELAWNRFTRNQTLGETAKPENLTLSVLVCEVRRMECNQTLL